MENKKCSKPPTRMGLFVIYHLSWPILDTLQKKEQILAG